MSNEKGPLIMDTVVGIYDRQVLKNFLKIRLNKCDFLESGWCIIQTYFGKHKSLKITMRKSNQFRKAL